ncbi:hypothetical protein BGZ65_002709, partial [Modicella reniformis]
MSRMSQDEGTASRVLTSIAIEDRYKDMAPAQGQRRSRSSQDLYDGVYKESALVYERAPAAQHRGSQSSTFTNDSSSTSSSVTRVAGSERETRSELSTLGDADTSTASAADIKDEDPLFNSDAPRVDFADGCSLIPSPPPSPSPVHSGSGSVSVRTSASTMAGDALRQTDTRNSNTTNSSSNISGGLLEEPKISLLSTSYPPPKTSLSFTPATAAAVEDNPQDTTSPPSPLRPL